MTTNDPTAVKLWSARVFREAMRHTVVGKIIGIRKTHFNPDEYATITIDPYTDPTLAHLDPADRPGMAAMRAGAEKLGKR